MDFYSGSRSHEFISFRLGKEMSGQPNPKSTEVIESESQQIQQIPEPEVAERSEDTRSLDELSSTSDTESCGAYFTRKMESLGAEEQIPAVIEGQIPEQDKASVSDLVKTSCT